jgi:hypothetical protein
MIVSNIGMPCLSHSGGIPEHVVLGSGNQNVIPVRKNNLYDEVVFSKPNKHKCQPPAAR